MNNSEKNSQRSKPPRTENRGGFDFVDYSQQTADFYLKFGARLKELRKNAHLTQEELAKMASIDRSYLSQVEVGKRRVSLHVAYRLARLLTVTLDDLLQRG